MAIHVLKIKNPLLLSFLETEDCIHLYHEYCKNPTSDLKKRIDEKFLAFYSKVRAISYFSKVIHFAAQHIDKKQRVFQSRNQLILDKPIPGEFGSGETATYLDSIADETTTIELDDFFDKLEDYVHDEPLYLAISLLTTKQKYVLYLAFIKNLSDTEIGSFLNISQQAVTKTKNTALKKVRRSLNVG